MIRVRARALGKFENRPHITPRASCHSQELHKLATATIRSLCHQSYCTTSLKCPNKSILTEICVTTGEETSFWAGKSSRHASDVCVKSPLEFSVSCIQCSLSPIAVHRNGVKIEPGQRNMGSLFKLCLTVDPVELSGTYFWVRTWSTPETRRYYRL
jgi:hypothetical protein